MANKLSQGFAVLYKGEAYSYVWDIPAVVPVMSVQDLGSLKKKDATVHILADPCKLHRKK